MAGATKFDRRHIGQVCLFPTQSLDSRPGEEHDQLQHVRINLPPGPSLPKFLTDHHISIASFFGTSWGVILQAYTAAERSIFGFVHEAVQNHDDHKDIDAVISIGSLHMDDTVSVVEMIRHLNFRSDHSKDSSANRDEFGTLRKDVFNSIIVHRDRKKAPLDFNLEHQRHVSELFPS